MLKTSKTKTKLGFVQVIFFFYDETFLRFNSELSKNCKHLGSLSLLWDFAMTIQTRRYLSFIKSRFEIANFQRETEFITDNIASCNWLLCREAVEKRNCWHHLARRGVVTIYRVKLFNYKPIFTYHITSLFFNVLDLFLGMEEVFFYKFREQHVVCVIP